MFCGTVSACILGVYTEGCQLSPCRSLYVIVNLDSVGLAVCLWCSGWGLPIQYVGHSIAVGLLCNMAITILVN